VPRAAALLAVFAAALAVASAAQAATGDIFFPQGEQLVAVPSTAATPQDAMTALLAGPSASQVTAGFRTYIPAGTPLRSLIVTDGVATVDLGEPFITGTNGESLDARVTQVVYTLTAAPGVTSVRLLVKGGTPLGLFPGINATAPLTRTALATPALPAPKPPAPGPEKPATDATRTLQEQLVALGYMAADGVDGRPGPQTSGAVLAFQKWQRLPRDGVAGPATLAALAKASRPTPIQQGGAGKRIEILLDRQLALAIDGGRVVRTIAISSGAPATATPPGSYKVFGRYDRWWSVPFRVWLPWSLQFVGGIALHEYPQVPATPVSHGCVRQTIYDARWLFDFTPLGTPVTVLARS
jgi:hypothetical protein